MLRFGLLKYKKLNNSASSSPGEELLHEGEGATTNARMGPCDDNGNQQRSATAVTTATTPVRQHHHQIHNQLNGSTMKNTNTLAMDSPSKNANNDKLSQEEKTSWEKKNPVDQQTTTVRPALLSTSSPNNNYKLLNAPTEPTPKKRTATLNCKARIYKCIKRILKRNNFSSKEQKVHPQHQYQHPQQQQVQDKSKVDYREIKSLLEKEKSALDYDVNLAKCVDKPALIKKIALNLLKSAEDEGRSLVIASERLSETTSLQSDLDQEVEYKRLCSESWYHENLPRDLSLDLLINKTPGTFIVRKSTTQQDCYALSLRVPPPGPKIAHYLIVRTATDGYQIKGFHKEFSSLRALIVHHSVMPEALPVPLAVPRPANLAVKTICEDDYDTVFDLTETTLA